MYKIPYVLLIYEINEGKIFKICENYDIVIMSFFFIFYKYTYTLIIFNNQPNLKV